MVVFQNSLPSTGNGALRNRENPRLYGTDKEHTLLQAADTYVTHSCCIAFILNYLESIIWMEQQQATDSTVFSSTCMACDF